MFKTAGLLHDPKQKVMIILILFLGNILHQNWMGCPTAFKRLREIKFYVRCIFNKQQLQPAFQPTSENIQAMCTVSNNEMMNGNNSDYVDV